MSTETILLAIIAVLAPTIAALTGWYQAQLSRRNKQSEAEKTRAEAEEIFERVRVMQLERERELIERLALLEKDRRALVDRLEAVEMELRFTKKRYEDDLATERARYETAVHNARKVQESLEHELIKLREMIDHLTKENASLHSKVKQLASRVETGELSNGKQRRAEA